MSVSTGPASVTSVTDMEKKSDKVRRLVAEGEFKAALSIAKDFRRGITREDMDDMRRGFEAMVSPRFYESLGMDTVQLARKGVEVVQRLYGA